MQIYNVPSSKHLLKSFSFPCVKTEKGLFLFSRSHGKIQLRDIANKFSLCSENRMTLVLLSITLWKTLRKGGLYVSYLIWYNSSDVESPNREKQCVVGTKGPRENNDARRRLHLFSCRPGSLVAQGRLGYVPVYIRQNLFSEKGPFRGRGKRRSNK